MILAGDIGGTKTLLALYEQRDGLLVQLREEVFASQEQTNLETVAGDFLRRAGLDRAPAMACFGVAGPVSGNRARITNLPWVVDGPFMQRDLGLGDVYLINDVQATAAAVPRLGSRQLFKLNEPTIEPGGSIGVVAPGTGLGEALLVCEGQGHLVLPSEGGHASYAPVTAPQQALLAFMQRRYDHVSLERVCSGMAVPDLYAFALEYGDFTEPGWLAKARLEAADETPVIIKAALEDRFAAAGATLDLFVENLAVEVGDMALRLWATGGVYLGGGICPRILQRLRQPDFIDTIRQKGRFSDWVAQVPVTVILEPKAALLGAAWLGLEREQTTH